MSHCGERRIPACMLLIGLAPFSPPFMSSDNQQPLCCLDQRFADFHTRHKQRLNMGAVQIFMESVLFLPSPLPLRESVESTGAITGNDNVHFTFPSLNEAFINKIHFDLSKDS